MCTFQSISTSINFLKIVLLNQNIKAQWRNKLSLQMFTHALLYFYIFVYMIILERRKKYIEEQFDMTLTLLSPCCKAKRLFPKRQEQKVAFALSLYFLGRFLWWRDLSSRLFSCLRRLFFHSRVKIPRISLSADFHTQHTERKGCILGAMIGLIFCWRTRLPRSICMWHVRKWNLGVHPRASAPSPYTPRSATAKYYVEWISM